MTHCQRVLDLLGDGQPHSHHELYSLNVIAHSRISDLRKRGHVIEMWREDDLYLYRLIESAGSEPQAHRLGAPSPFTYLSSEAPAAPSDSAEQLELVA